VIFMNKKILVAAVALGIIVFGILGYKLILGKGGSGSPVITSSKISKDKYQAVFLANDQVYFGKLKDIESAYPVLEDVYYLVTAGTVGGGENISSQVLGEAEGEAGNLAVSPKASENGAGFVLVKLGNEVHGPEDKLVLNRDHILFVEDLREDGKLVSAIKSSKEIEAGGGQETEQNQ